MLRTWILTCACVVARVALADPTAMVVVGKAEGRERIAVAAAVLDVMRASSWQLTAYNSFSDAEIAQIVGCLAVDRPWRCVALIARDKDFDRIVVVQVDPLKGKEGAQLVLVAQVVGAANAVPPMEQQFCGPPCSDADLRRGANELARRLVHRYETAPTMEVPSPGARAASDPAPSPGARAASDPGPSRARAPSAEGHAPPSSPSLALPIALVSVGGAAVLGGVVAIALDEPSSTAAPGAPQRRYYYDTVPPGLAAIASGVVLAAIGGVWWRDRRVAPSVAVVPGGAALSLTGAF